MFINRIVAGLFGAATVLTVTNAFAQAPSAQDKAFMVKLCQGNHAEIAVGELALRKSQNAKVRGVAQTIVSEHKANETKLQALADKYNVRLPNAPDAVHKAAAKKLATLSGKEFDSKYIGGQITDHHATIVLLQTEMAKGKNSEARSFATETLGGVLKHTDAIHKVSGTSTNKTMSKMGGMKTGMASPAHKVNAQIRASLVSRKTSVNHTVLSGTSVAPGKPGGSAVVLRPKPQPSHAPGLD